MGWQAALIPTIAVLALLVPASYQTKSVCPLKSCNTNRTRTLFVYSCASAGCTEFPLDDNLDILVNILDLSNNSITSIPQLHFKKMTSMNLANNQIKTIEENAFASCHSLMKLNLTGNQLGPSHMVNTTFKGLGNLTTLDLSNNHISAINNAKVFHPSNFKLQVLDLRHNDLSYLHPNALTDQTALVSLHLSYNKLTTLVNGTFDSVITLKYLYLDHNELTTLPEEIFYDLGHLVMLDLRHNRITEVTSQLFFGLNSLEVLHFSGNELTIIGTEMFAHLLVLQDIYIHDNPIQVIEPRAFPNEIQKISIASCNQLKSIKNGTFSDLKFLKEIYVEDNEVLQSIEAGAFDMENSAVKTAYFKNNDLWTLNERLLDWKAMKMVDLSGNRWDCDCGLQWMKHGYFPQHIQDTVLCDGPEYLKDKRISEVDESQLTCSFFRKHRYEGAVALAVMVSLLFATAAVILAYRYRTKVLPCWFGKNNDYNPLTEDVQEPFEDDEITGEVVFSRTPKANDRVGFRLANEDTARPTAV